MSDAEAMEPTEELDAVEVLDLESEMTPEQLAEAKEYGQRELICDLIGRVADITFLLVFVFFLAHPDSALVAGISQWTSSATLRLLTLAVVLTGLNLVVTFPFSYYSGHVLEHRYGLSRQSFSGWTWRYTKQHLIGIVFSLVMFTGLYWLIWLTGTWWWLVAAGAFFLVSVVLGQLAPVLIMPLFHKIEKLDPKEPENADLSNRMARLSEGTGLSIEGVYRMKMSDETVKANAMLGGLGSTRRVILGDTLLDNFTPEEIEVILAHEVGHHVYRHITKMILTGLVFCAVGLWGCDQLLTRWLAGVQGGAAVDYANFPFYTLPMLMLIITLFSTVMEPLQNFISRFYERQCDRYALKRTGLRDDYRSAFKKLAKLNKDDPAPHPLEVFLFHSHPPITERLSFADE